MSATSDASTRCPSSVRVPKCPSTGHWRSTTPSWTLPDARPSTTPAHCWSADSSRAGNTLLSSRTSCGDVFAGNQRSPLPFVGKMYRAFPQKWSPKVYHFLQHCWLLKTRETPRRSNLMSAFFEGGASLWAKISDGRERRPPTTVGVRKQEWLPFRVILSQSMCVTDRRKTDGRTDIQTTELRLPRPR